MTRRWLLGVVLCAACGRFEFAEQVTEKKTVELVYPASATYHAVIELTELMIEPAFDKAALQKFTVNPPLPDGLTLEPTTGKISGKPTENVDRKTYIVTATGQDGIASAELTFTVLQGMVVTSTEDELDMDGGMDDLCLATNGKCTLRAAVETASKHATKGRHLILLGPGSYTLTRGDMKYIKADLAIVGMGVGTTFVRPGQPHDGFRWIHLEEMAKVRLEKMTVTEFGPSEGGVVLMNKGLLEAYEVEFKNNVAPAAGGVLDIYDGAEARFGNVRFVDNDASVPENAGWGGVINATGVNTRVFVDKSTATGNRAKWGAFAHVHLGAELVVTNSTLHHNTSTEAGTLATPSGTIELTNVTLAYNKNTHASRRSAGIFIYSQPGGYKMANSIVAFNTDVSGAQNNCQNDGLADHLDSLGGNLFNDLAGNCAISFTQEGDGLSMDPLFDQPNAANHGGGIETMALTADSPALDRGIGDLCPKDDQRGWPRKLSALGTCDAGAFELP